MDMYNTQANSAMNHNTPSHATAQKKNSLRRIVSTHWGIALVCALIAAAIGVSALHTSHVESRASEVPEVESVSVLPLD